MVSILWHGILEFRFEYFIYDSLTFITSFENCRNQLWIRMLIDDIWKFGMYIYCEKLIFIFRFHIQYIHKWIGWIFIEAWYIINLDLVLVWRHARSTRFYMLAELQESFKKSRSSWLSWYLWYADICTYTFFFFFFNLIRIISLSGKINAIISIR